MTTDQTDPRPDGRAAEPLALRLNAQLGPLPEAPIIGVSRFGSVFRGYSADHMRAYAAQEVAAERERIRALVGAVRDANAASQDEDDCLIYTPALQRAWQALMDGLEGPNGMLNGSPEAQP